MINPLFGAIIALQVREKEGRPIINDAQEAKSALLQAKFDVDRPPDLIAAGSNSIITPCVEIPPESPEGRVNFVIRPFFIEGETKYVSRTVGNHAFAMSICTLLWTIDTIRLGPLPWPRILEEGYQKLGQE